MLPVLVSDNTSWTGLNLSSTALCYLGQFKFRMPWRQSWLLMEIVMNNGAIWVQVENMFPVKSLSPQARILFSQLSCDLLPLPLFICSKGCYVFTTFKRYPDGCKLHCRREKFSQSCFFPLRHRVWWSPEGQSDAEYIFFYYCVCIYKFYIVTTTQKTQGER